MPADPTRLKQHTVIALTLIVMSAVSPRALPDSELTLFVPRLDKTTETLPFFTAAGTRVSLLRPESWRELSHPILRFDPTSIESMKAGGVDPTGSLTVSQKDKLEISCVTLADVKAFETACDARLKSLGKVSRTVEPSGVAVVTTKDELNRTLRAYAIKGKISCAATNHGQDLDAQSLGALSKLTAAAKTPTEPGYRVATDLPGVASIIRPRGSQVGAVSVSAKGLTSTLDAAVGGPASALVFKPGVSPFALSGVPSSRLLALRFQLEKDKLAQSIDQFTRRAPGGRFVQEPLQALAPLMTGHFLVVVDRVEVTASLSTEEARFRALKMAVLVETTNGEAAKTALDAVLEKGTMRKNTLRLGTRGTLAYLYNDDAALKLALAMVTGAAPAKLQHALEFQLDPALVAKGLSQVPLIDAIQNNAMAGLLAASSELGPLLLVSDSMTGWVDSSGASGSHRAQLIWPLKADRFR